MADKLPKGSPEPMEDTPAAFLRWLWVWHTLTYIALIIGMVQALIITPRPVEEKLVIGGLSIAYALWYVVAAAGRYAVFENRVLLMLGYFALGWVLWFGLAAYDSMYYLLLIGLFPQVFGAPPPPWNIIGALLLMALVVCRQALSGVAITWTYAIIIGMSYIGSIALAWFIYAVIKQSQERKRLIEELREAQEGLSAAERQAGMLEERQRLAREIHDTLAQGFTSIIMHLETMDAHLSPDQEDIRKYLDLARQSARASLAEARRMVWALQPESLERRSLEDAITRYAGRWSKETGIGVKLSVVGEPCHLPPEYEVTLLRTTQEGLANIRRHAQAHSVTLTLTYMDDLVALDIRDDGIGFDPEPAGPDLGEPTGGFGLRSMRERAEILGGTFALESTPGGGTTIAVALPITEKAKDHAAD
nr:sensor histidine kinase [Anaerolineae bacterium]